MGRRVHMFRCDDCLDEYGYSGEEYDETRAIRGGFEQPPYFFEKMEHFGKEELLEHIRDIECPVCGSENWTMTDYSVI